MSHHTTLNSVSSSDPGTLQVGTAKVDITSPADALPPGYTSVHDPVYARAIVINNGTTRAVLLGADLVGMVDDAYAELTQQITQEVGCPPENILISCTHTHASPRPGAGFRASAPVDPRYVERVKKGLFEAVRQANQTLQPARVGFGTGQFHMNVNRDAIHPESRTWYQGANLDGPSDKTLSVIKFVSLSGEPIAVYINYAMHANLMYMRNQIGGDFPGACARYLEDVYDEKLVAIWTSGAAGDQNPLYIRLGEPAVAAMKRSQFAAAGGDPSDVHGIAQFTDAVLDPKILDRGTRLIDSIGLLMGEEVIRVMETIRRTATQTKITGALRTISCPGRRRTNTGREGSPGIYEDAEPIDVRLGLLTIGSIALPWVTAELFTPIGQRLKEQSPMQQMVLVTLANGSSAGYIPDDSAYERQTFQVLGSRIKKGYAEGAIVDTLVDLMDESLYG